MQDQDSERGLGPTRRQFVIGAALTGAVGAVTALEGGDDGQGDLFGGTMALSKAYKFAEGPDGAIWIGPNSAKSNVASDKGNVYLSSDTEEVFRGDGSSWVSMGLGANLTDSGSDNADGGNQYQLPQAEDSIDLQGSGDIENAASVTTDDLNSIHWADNLDEIDDLLNNTLPSHGGVVKLTPGSYTDSDWSQRIDIPNNDDSHYVIDMRGSTIDLGSFSPTTAYILKSSAGTLSQRSVEIYGPKIMDVQDVTDPPGFIQVDDIENSRVYVPGGRGAVDFVVKNVQTQGSGHMNKMSAQWRSPLKGYIIEGSGVSNDRSFYWGQIQNISNIGIEAINAQNNHFYAQPESGQGSAVGYDLDTDSDNNWIWMAHQNLATPLDVEGVGNHVGWLLTAGAGRDVLRDSKPGIRPKNWHAGSTWMKQWHTFQTDETAILSDSGDGSVSVNNFTLCNISAGGSDGNSHSLNSTSRPGIIGSGYLLFFNFKLNTATNAIYRIGIGSGSSNWLGLLADSSDADGNWHFKHVDGGTDQTDTETDTATSQDTGKHTVKMMIENGQQEIFYDGAHIHSATETINLNAGDQSVHMEAENSGGTSARLDIHQFEYMGLDG